MSKNNSNSKEIETEVPSLETFIEFYSKTFIKQSGTLARNGKSVYIQPEIHERITRIVQTIGNNKMSLTDYLHNVLEHHFEVFEQSIIEIYTKKQRPLF